MRVNLHEIESHSFRCAETSEACAAVAAAACAARTTEPNKKGPKGDIVMDKLMADSEVSHVVIGACPLSES